MTARTWIIGLVCPAASWFYAQPAAYGQQAGITGPSSGFVFDNSAHGLRPIRGIPGASVIGAPIEFGFDIASASVSPSLDSALVVSANGGVHLFRIDNTTPVERLVDGLAVDKPPAPHHVVFSPSGMAG